MGIGASGGSSPTYFQRQTSLPANTIIRFVPQQTAWIVERMGKFNRILEPGLAILMPVIDVRQDIFHYLRKVGLTNSAAHSLRSVIERGCP
jgi:regulator of protease activity HflC (stomatin/prohibitin superfamily)